ncbi:MAG: energy transducer TonB [Candidatus Omnitrophica bacterium]|nr:energy transducer TonB [Candidatus Omnitrophota bacterium]MBI2495468.1 energy transducer TonB [Candidatus Omnitrophota bacterium]MBI3021211.1 energy transducer TonB [Candidatus Omnitrophota bacterium]MBI3083746.1 energy transducer TonB [Candidatus Omnitrophota bacterium]
MTLELKLALAASVGVHAGLFVGLPATSPIAFDVERAPTSLAIYVVAPLNTPPTMELAPPEPQLPVPPPDTAAVIPEEPDPAPQTVVVPEQRGALTEVLPAYLQNPAPVYPRLARERGYQGAVVLSVEVLPSGRCGQLRILESSGHAMLDSAAASAVQRWQFRPARRFGTPVALWVEIPITFRLVDNGGD